MKKLSHPSPLSLNKVTVAKLSAPARPGKRKADGIFPTFPTTIW